MSKQITRRRVDFKFDPAKADSWYSAQRGEAFFYNTTSFFFPPGEKFFIESVQHYQDRITDPALRDQVKDFIYQEAMHTTMHVRYNQAIASRYPDMAIVERIGESMLNLARRVTPKFWQLAVTCALEHFTAIFADDLLSHQEYFMQHSDPEFARLWFWHAAEELEHKAVCFDVYQTIMGKGPFSYLIRVLAMVVVTGCFMFAILLGIGRLRRHGGKSSSQPGNKSALRLRVPVFIRRMLGKQYRDYFRPSFHPWDHDNQHLIEEWKRQNPELNSIPVAQVKAWSGQSGNS